MTTLFDATAARKVNRTFGTGIVAAHPAAKPAPVSDEDWAAQVHGEQSDRRDARIDRELAEVTGVSVADVVLHAGSNPKLCPCKPCVMARTARYIRHEARRSVMAAETADYIERTSLVGHPA